MAVQASDDVQPAPAVAPPITAPTFAEVYREHVAFIWRVVRRLGVHPADVDDVCQDVFVVVHRKLPAFEGRSTVRTWLYGIAVRCAADHRRRAHVQRETTATSVAEAPVDPAQPGAVAERQARAALDQILDQLDEAKRAVFVLYELEELPMIEVAEAVGCPLQTAYSRLHAARDAVEAAVLRRAAKERGS